MNKNAEVLNLLIADLKKELGRAEYRRSMFPQERDEHMADIRELRRSINAVSAAIESLEQSDNLAKVREYCESEKSCGVLRSMDNTVRANTFQEILDYIDSLSGGDS